jgi:hypothetical protein
MSSIERSKDLIGFLLILQSVCVKNNGAIKVDEEYQKLSTMHSAIGFRQKKSISNFIFVEQVLDRYGSAIGGFRV